MFSRTRMYRNPEALASAPSLATNLPWMLNTVPADQQLRALYLQSIRNTAFNREISFWNEPVVISFAYITAYTVLGDGIKVLTENRDAKDIIGEWNDQINVGRQSIDDLFVDAYVDNIIHKNAFWRIMYLDDLPTKVDVARLDPTTLKKERSRVQGYEIIIQSARKEMKTFYSKESYYNYWREKANRQGMTGPSGIGDLSTWNSEEESDYSHVVIPNESKYILEFEFFRRPPISSVLNHMAYKRWILWFMRQYAERYWSPFRIGYVGNPQFYMPESPEEFKKERDLLMQALIAMKSFGALATPGYNKIEETSHATSKSSSIYVDYMNYLNEEMMFAMMGSMGIRAARGAELATSRILEQGFLRYALGIRGRFNRILRNFYIGQLLPQNGINLSKNELSLRFSPMIIESVDKVVRAVGEAADRLFFEDWNEPRQILQSVFGDVMDELPADKAKQLQDKFVELNSKSVPQFGNAPPQAGAQ